MLEADSIRVLAKIIGNYNCKRVNTTQKCDSYYLLSQFPLHLTNKFFKRLRSPVVCMYVIHVELYICPAIYKPLFRNRDHVQYACSVPYLKLRPKC